MAFDLDQLRARLRAAHPVPLSFDHLHADAMWRRLGFSDVVVDVEDAETVEPVTRTRKRRPSLTTALAQAAAAGMTVSGATITPEGSVMLTFGDGSTTINPWDEVLTNAAN